MIIATATLESATAYSQSKHVTTPKKTGENPEDYEERTWRQRMHVTPEGRVEIPPMAFKNALQSAAKYLSMSIPGNLRARYTKHFEAGIVVLDPLVLNVKAEEVKGEWFFVPSDGKPGGGTRVMRCFPKIPSWSGDVVFHILDHTITEEAFRTALEGAGLFIGIGRFRPQNRGYYGRFIVKKIKGDWPKPPEETEATSDKE